MGELNVESRTLFIADNLEVLRGINSESIDLIATDPPFNKGVKDFEGIVTAGVDEEGKKVWYKDIWTWGDVQSEWTESIRRDHPNLHAVIRAANAAAGDDMGAYLCWLGVRALEMHRVLKPTGSIYLHCDSTAGAWIKTMLDAVFGRKNFRNEVVWRRHTSVHGSFQHAPKQWGTITDTILFYAKSHDTPISPYRPLGGKDALKKFNLVDENGDRYYDDSAHIWNTPNMGARPNQCYEWRGFKNPYPSGWRLIKSRLEEEFQKGNIVILPNGRLQRRKYQRDFRGTPTGNFWNDIEPAAGQERTGYPHQKPLALYERIIKASSNEGDTVLDPFAGCATTCVAAERLGREWIGIDINEPAKDVIRDRLTREVTWSMAWGKLVKTPNRPPKRTDDGKEAAPELVLVSPRPRYPRLSARELRSKLAIADGMKCQGCGWVPHHEEYLEVDHKVPKSNGGRDDMRNRVLLCGPCNGAKGNKLTLAELRRRRLGEGRMADKAWNEEWYERTGRFGEPIAFRPGMGSGP